MAPISPAALPLRSWCGVSILPRRPWGAGVIAARGQQAKPGKGDRAFPVRLFLVQPVTLFGIKRPALNPRAGSTTVRNSKEKP